MKDFFATLTSAVFSVICLKALGEKMRVMSEKVKSGGIDFV